MRTHRYHVVDMAGNLGWSHALESAEKPQMLLYGERVE